MHTVKSSREIRNGKIAKKYNLDIKAIPKKKHRAALGESSVAGNQRRYDRSVQG